MKQLSFAQLEERGLLVPAKGGTRRVHAWSPQADRIKSSHLLG